MNLSDMRTLVRRDLHDEDSTTYRWTDTELNHHIQHAVQEFSLFVPLETTASLTTSASRDLSLTSLSSLIGIEAVEYPIDKYPPVYETFSRWGNTLTLLVNKVPTAGETVRVYYTKLHTLDATSSTIPSHLEDLVALGAAAYAALEWSSFATNRVNVGGTEAWKQYLTWGKEQLHTFQQTLNRLAARNTVRPRQLYVSAKPKPSQSTDWGP
ncbi:MAG: hypothetical protein HYY31_02090 [Chloroflexi bacterium]|nr:hypothetical protein [Chloroflexota bacterium]